MNSNINLLIDFHEILDSWIDELKLIKIPNGSKDLKYIRLFTYMRKANCMGVHFKIYESKEFKAEKEKYKYVLDELYSRAKNGKSWVAFLSKQYKNLSYVDHLFNNWSILHFHLGDSCEEDGMIKRTGDLAIAYVNYAHSNLYFLRIQGHKDKPWYDDSLFQVIYDNWPDILNDYMYDGEFTINSSFYTKDKIKKAQNNGELIFYRIRNKDGQ